MQVRNWNISTSLQVRGIRYTCGKTCLTYETNQPFLKPHSFAATPFRSSAVRAQGWGKPSKVSTFSEGLQGSTGSKFRWSTISHRQNGNPPSKGGTIEILAGTSLNFQHGYEYQKIVYPYRSKGVVISKTTHCWWPCGSDGINWPPKELAD